MKAEEDMASVALTESIQHLKTAVIRTIWITSFVQAVSILGGALGILKLAQLI